MPSPHTKRILQKLASRSTNGKPIAKVIGAAEKLADKAVFAINKAKELELDKAELSALENRIISLEAKNEKLNADNQNLHEAVTDLACKFEAIKELIESYAKEEEAKEEV